ncbi:MAG: TIGR03936 family radical SAM-associated protein [Oscillospiraceae bacterium]|nr:TIGR03936 family radical SAM-associated protein [Oscillospiraceae bacterium]
MRKVRVMYKKFGRAIYISHLDIMRTFQRVLTRAGIAVKHTEGFNPHPYISIALPLSLGYTGVCEFLDMVIENDMPNEEIASRMNSTLPEGIEVISVYENYRPVRDIAYSGYEISMEYDEGLPLSAIKKLSELFSKEEIVVLKKSKRGEVETNIAPLIKLFEVSAGEGVLNAKAVLAAGSASLNPEYLIKAIEKYLPDCGPDFAEYTRVDVFDTDMKPFR